MQRPTTKYSVAETPPANFPTVYPVRQKHTTADPYAPSTVENMATYAEDPLIWYSGGQYHVVYDYPDDKVGYHLTSPDGIHDWTDQGIAYDPRMAKQLFSYADGSVVSWTKLERPDVIMENGHIAHFTFSVADVEKAQITGGSNHGNKVIVMAFDGVAFDNETGIGGSDGGAPGSGGQGGGHAGAMGGSGGSNSGGTSGMGGNSAASGGSSGHGGATTGTGANGGSSGCSCALGETPRCTPGSGALGCLLGLGAFSLLRRRRRRMLAQRQASSARCRMRGRCPANRAGYAYFAEATTIWSKFTVPGVVSLLSPVAKMAPR